MAKKKTTSAKPTKTVKQPVKEKKPKTKLLSTVVTNVTPPIPKLPEKIPDKYPKPDSRDIKDMPYRFRLFVLEYLKDHSAAGAYKRAGYKWANEGVADVGGHTLMKKPGVRKAIENAEANLLRRHEATTDRYVAELAMIAFADSGDILDFTGTEFRLKPANEIPEHARRAISSIKTKRYLEGHGDDAREVEVTEYKCWNKIAALKELREFMHPVEPPSPASINVYPNGISDDELLNRLRSIADRVKKRLTIAGGEEGSPVADPAADGTGNVSDEATERPGDDYDGSGDDTGPLADEGSAPLF